MKPKTLAILAALVLALSGFIYFYERKLPSSEERKKLAKRVLTLESNEVRAVSIERGEQKLTLERIDLEPTEKTEKADGEKEEQNTEGADDVPLSAADGEWRMTAPLVARADRGAVGRLVESLLALEHSETIEAPNLAETGLDRPQAKIRLTTADGEKVLEVGAKLPLGSNVVVRLAGESIAYAVGDSFLADLDRDAGEWRDKRLFPGERDDVQKIEFFGSQGGPAASAVLERRAGKFWIDGKTAAGALSDRADRERVEALLSDLSGLTADRFVDPPTATPEMGLEPPHGVLSVTLANRKEPVRIEIGGLVGGASEGEMPARYVRLEGQIATAREHLSEAIARGASDWRSRGLLDLDVYQVERAEIVDDQGKVLVQRDGADWRRGDVIIPYTPVSDLLYSLTTLQATEIVSPAEAKAKGANLGKPTMTFDLRGEKDETAKIELFPAGAAGVPARADGRDAILFVSAEQLAALRTQLAALRAEKAIPKSESTEEP